jgi:hypothetical protein
MRHRRPRTRIGWYMRARLRRRIFVWFGLTIALTFAVTSGRCTSSAAPTSGAASSSARAP